MDLQQVLRAGRSGFVYTALSITAVLIVGLLLGQVFKVDEQASLLISSGTAICGGSAIAAISPIVAATDGAIAISLGTFFVLNSVALLIFPFIGTVLHLTQPQFGLWSALAIHDTSSVVGATAKYGAIALAVGTTVKLARALWIVPLSIGISLVKKSKSQTQWPWFILFFFMAVLLKTYVPMCNRIYPPLARLGTIGLTVTLFLIGTGISRNSLREVGPRPLLQGILLWAFIAIGSLLLIKSGWIAVS